MPSKEELEKSCIHEEFD